MNAWGKRIMYPGENWSLVLAEEHTTLLDTFIDELLCELVHDAENILHFISFTVESLQREQQTLIKAIIVNNYVEIQLSMLTISKLTI